MSVYNFEVLDANKQTISLSEYKGKVLLIVNTASYCGFTKQFEGLQELYEKYQSEGLEILGFPCNQFNEQDPDSIDDIVSNCKLNYGVTFDMFDKIEVNGENQHPLYAYLKSQKGGMFNDAIKWNFTKFLVSRNGEVIKRYAPTTTPKEIEKDIIKELKQGLE